MRFVSFVGIFLAAMVGGAGGCSGGGSGDDDDGGGGGSSGQGGASGAAGSPYNNGSAGFPGTGGSSGSGGGQGQQLLVEPAKVTLTAKGQPLTQAFVARLADGSEAKGAAWAVDDVGLGLVGQDGLFSSKGFTAGTTTVRASFGGRTGTAQVEVVVDIKDAGPVTPGDQGKLETGGDPKAVSFLYPNDFENAGVDVPTVFPRGVGAPLVQLTGSKASAMRVLVETAGYRYEGFFGPNKTEDGKAELNVNQVPVPDTIWQGLVASARPGEPIKVTATALIGATVAGPVQERWTIAPGSLKGIVYYNSYDSRLPGVPEDGDGRPGGPAVLAIKPGQTAQPLLTGCTVCHSVSSQGNRLVTGVEWAADEPDSGDEPNNPRDGASYELKADGTTELKYEENDGRRYAFGALSPDGKWLLSNGVVGQDSRFIRGLQGEATVSESKLYETDTGASVPTTGLSVQFAMTPAFSHDGSMVAFNRIGPFPLPAPPANGDPALETTNRSTLSVVTFNGAMSPPAFGPVTDVLDATVPPVKAGEKVRAWPSFLPDGKALVFHEGTQFDTGNSREAIDSKAFAHVRMVELATKRVVALRALNGEKPDGSGSALPSYPGDASDHSSMSYEPTVLPVPVGGYYWVFFTSRRAYGNTVSPGGVVTGGEDAFGKRLNGQENPSPRKKIWVAAIDLDYAEKLAKDPTYDPSHPAFFVTGQELSAGNMRAFAALEPCRQQGSNCESSTECCDGRSCRQNGVDASGQPILQCIDPPPNECAREDESCGDRGDCCGAAEDEDVLCINGRCTHKPPVIK